MATLPVNPQPNGGGASLPPFIVGRPFNPHILECGFNVGRAVTRDRSLGLTNGQKILFQDLLWYAGKDGLCFPSHGALAEDTGRKDERGIARDLRELERAGLIRAEKRFRNGGGQTSNLYEFLYHPIFDKYRERERLQIEANREKRQLQIVHPAPPAPPVKSTAPPPVKSPPHKAITGNTVNREHSKQWSGRGDSGQTGCLHTSGDVEAVLGMMDGVEREYPHLADIDRGEPLARNILKALNGADPMQNYWPMVRRRIGEERYRPMSWGFMVELARECGRKHGNTAKLQDLKPEYTPEQLNRDFARIADKMSKGW